MGQKNHYASRETERSIENLDPVPDIVENTKLDIERNPVVEVIIIIQNRKV